MALAEFLADQEARLSDTTFRQYKNIVGLLRVCLERYWPDCDREEYDRTGGIVAKTPQGWRFLEVRNVRP